MKENNIFIKNIFSFLELIKPTKELNNFFIEYFLGINKYIQKGVNFLEKKKKEKNSINQNNHDKKRKRLGNYLYLYINYF